MSIISEIPAGQVQITPLEHGRFLVQIGRAWYVKRLDLSSAEAAELVRQLIGLLAAS